MTLYADGIESGILGVTSGLSTRSHMAVTRYRNFVGGGNQTWTGFFPYGSLMFHTRLHINAQGSATTSDRMTISTSAGSTTLVTYSSMGSATGMVGNSTITSLATVVNVTSACSKLGPNVEGAEIPFQVILSSVDTATDYSLQLEFVRPFKAGT